MLQPAHNSMYPDSEVNAICALQDEIQGLQPTSHATTSTQGNLLNDVLSLSRYLKDSPSAMRVDMLEKLVIRARIAEVLGYNAFAYRRNARYPIISDIFVQSGQQLTADLPGDMYARVWGLLAPAVPDHLKTLDAGIYEAQWWKPVPPMDVEMIIRTPGIHLLGQPFEPENLTKGIAVRFAITCLL